MNRSALLAAAPGTFYVGVAGTQIELVVREDGVRIERYPRQCAVDMKLAVWLCESVLPVALLVRLGKSNLTTFHRWINATQSGDLRILQALTRMDTLEVRLIWEAGERVFPWRNGLQHAARTLISRVQGVRPWTAADFERERRRIDHELPTAHAAWWAVVENPQLAV